MSDRTETVLANIDDALDDWDVSSDAMRWTPPDEEEPLNDVINRALDAAANESMDRVAHILATQPHTASAVHQAITQALNRERLLDTLTATVPDQADAYLDACDRSPRIALEYAQVGIPPAMIPSLRENGITAVQAAISINTTDRSAL